jgi:predicted dehydrogenase
MWHSLTVPAPETQNKQGGGSMGGNPKTTSYEDTMLVAFLKLKGFTVIPWVSRDDPSDIRVSFDVQGDEGDIEAAINAFYGNEMIGIQDFCKSFKETKSNMHALKRVGRS